MYEKFFNFKHRPFAAAPQVEQYFPGAAVETARSALLRCLERGEGIGLVIGPTGAGKTLLCQVLAAQCRDAWRVATLACGRLGSRRSLFQSILYELGQAYRGMDEGELRLALIDFLTLGRDPCQGLVLLVDEAQTLPLHLLDEIRLLTNLARAGQPLVRVLLAGNGALEERLAGPKLDSFHQRIAARCYLEPFSREETGEYIRFQVQGAGNNDPELFSRDACRSVFQATDGVPRLINQLCDHVLLAAYVADKRRIGPADVEEAWSDLQQLPTPWNNAGPTPDNHVIEFGSLEQTAEEPDAAEKEVEATQLRLADGSEETDDFTGPEHQIANIKHLISEAEDDFQPAGAIRPEIELAFADTEDPFQEEFAQEEKIADRYTGLTAFTPPPREPHVSINRETKLVNQEAGHLINQEAGHSSCSAEVTSKNARLPESIDIPPALPEPLQESMIPPVTKDEDWVLPPSDRLLSPRMPINLSAAETAVNSTGTAGFAAESGSLATSESISVSTAANLPAGSALLEEECSEPISSPPRRTDRPGRPREFRRLFARLRQG